MRLTGLMLLLLAGGASVAARSALAAQASIAPVAERPPSKWSTVDVVPVTTTSIDDLLRGYAVERGLRPRYDSLRAVSTQATGAYFASLNARSECIATTMKSAEYAAARTPPRTAVAAAEARKALDQMNAQVNALFVQRCGKEVGLPEVTKAAKQAEIDMANRPANAADMTDRQYQRLRSQVIEWLNYENDPASGRYTAGAFSAAERSVLVSRRATLQQTLASELK